MSSGSNDKQPERPLGVYECKQRIHDIFQHTGRKDLIMAHIRHKATEQGWSRKVRDVFIEHIKKAGPDNVNVSQMIASLAPTGRALFPPELKEELAKSMYEVAKEYFTIVDDTVTAITEPNNENSDAENEKTVPYQAENIKQDPDLGVGIERLDIADSPAPSPPRQIPDDQMRKIVWLDIVKQIERKGFNASKN